MIDRDVESGLQNPAMPDRLASMMSEMTTSVPSPWCCLRPTDSANLRAEFHATIAANLSNGGVCGQLFIKELILDPEQTEGVLCMRMHTSRLRRHLHASAAMWCKALPVWAMQPC